MFHLNLLKSILTKKKKPQAINWERHSTNAKYYLLLSSELFAGFIWRINLVLESQLQLQGYVWCGKWFVISLVYYAWRAHTFCCVQKALWLSKLLMEKRWSWYPIATSNKLRQIHKQYLKSSSIESRSYSRKGFLEQNPREFPKLFRKS